LNGPNINMLKSRDTWAVLGLPFDVVDLNRSVTLIEEAIEQNTHCFLSTPNLNFAIAAQSDTEFFNSVVESDLSVADGMPLVWVAKLLDLQITERVAGSTLFDQLSNKPRKNKIKVFFFGGQKGIAEQAHRQLNTTSLGMLSCGFYDPGFVSIDQMSSTKIINQINEANPDFILVALGAKKGQQWIQNNRQQLTAPVISHLGAVINFVAGNVLRAPSSWQHLGLEWLWRIKQEPTLWKRYFFDGLTFTYILLTKVLPLSVYDRVLQRYSFINKSYTLSRANNLKNHIELSGTFKHPKLKQAKIFLSNILDTHGSNIMMDFSEVMYIDAAFIGTLLLFQNELKKKGKSLFLINLPKRIKRIMILNMVQSRFKIK
jgi:N-acetylglucosaminyldiphosphoundecaprenol N-acetyl-beta-D-mannosaminyltransferase